ncbi:MAG: prephenate dehydrogenase/arogenate dehydrogenase family protein, partial [Candidatus Omnitrophica bacterium]|nr:prephenate dehydrogenase/arogenate dehydrogenase family protein [Candidatus Omnitrophota bacterium]
SEHTSVDFARHDLMEGASCIVVKTGRTDDKALRKVASFWKSLGGSVSVMHPESHDRRVSMISHLPHAVAFALAGSVDPKDLKFAAEGFKDTTRVASSDPDLWADIFLTNARETKRAGDVFLKSFKELINSVQSGDRRKLVRILKQAKFKRDAKYAKAV